MYNVKDNAEARLQVGLSSLSTTLVVELWTWTNFPDPPFILTLNKRDKEWNITKSEKVEVIAKDWDQFTINRGFEDTTPTDFNVWDYASLFVLSRHIKDLQSWLELAWNKITWLTTRLTTAEETINDLVRAWAIDHLETNLVVWEKYSSTDNLFAQYTPKYETSTVAIPLGNTATNTQIHIQRASSWVVWNTIKMKIRKVWEPTTKLIAEIQKSRLVDTWTECYRYWDWTSIATSELPYSSFTTDRQELTFTFDNPFWEWTQELLSVVIHQDDNIVNASNYYEIAADSTQYSESFRAVFVNWSTRTYNKMMPYCEWTGLASSMLCRCEETRYTVPYDLPLLEWWSWYITNGSERKFIPSSKWSNIKISWHVNCSISSSYSNRFWYFNIIDWWDGTTLLNKQWSINEDISLDTNKSSESANILINIGVTYNWRSASYSNLNIITTNWSITKTKNWTKVKVTSVANVWEVVPAILIGKVWNEYFTWWEYCEEDKYELSFSSTWWSKNNAWFKAHCNWLVKLRIATSSTDHINYLSINWVQVLATWSGWLWQTLPIKKWDEIYGYADYSWWNTYADFYPE